MSLDYFDSRLLTGVVVKRPPKPQLITQLFFKPQPPQPTDKFELHVQAVQRQIVPLVSDVEGASVVQGRSGEAVLAKAPRIRLKRPFKAVEILRNLVGMTPYDLTANPVEMSIAEQMQDFRDDIEYTIEFMCAQLATQGKLTMRDKVDGQTRVIYELDLLRSAEHSVDISSASARKWNGSSAKIRKDITEWSQMIATATGQGATDLVLGSNVVDLFLDHSDVKDKLDNRRMDIGQLTFSVHTLHKGTWNGVNIWEYPYKITDRVGESIPLIAPDSILLGTREAGQVIEYGLPLDRQCTGPTSYFSKTYDEDDPSQTWVLVESRPLPWTRNPDAFVYAKVLGN